MKKFKDKKLDNVMEDAKTLGWEIDMEKFDKGGDWIYLRDMYGKVESNEGIPRQIAYNATNGHFFVFEPFFEEAVATHLSKELDEEPWYASVLNLVYTPIKQ
jgi:hypothetical protein